MFFNPDMGQKKTNLIQGNSRTVFTETNFSNVKGETLSFYNTFERKVKKKIAEGAYKKELPLGALSNFFSNTISKQSLENLLLNYSGSNSYYSKNIKNSVKNIDDLSGFSGL